MKTRLGTSERRFAEIIWREAPLSSGQLIKFAEQELGWKKTTSYTVLKRLTEKGLFVNQNSTVSVLISKDDFLKTESKGYVDEAFSGSLPAFFLAFAADQGISAEEAETLKRMIDEAKQKES